MNKIIEAAGALIYCSSTKRFLWLMRTQSYNNTWGLVGGKKEANENILECLEREMREELGIEVKKEKIMPLETFTSKDTNFFYYSYVISVKEEFIPILNDEHSGFCWLDWRQTPKPLHPGAWNSLNDSDIFDKLSTAVAYASQ